ncbi:hypothetical protein [Desulfitibacter alkalitolerans]|uniref:hypothetical protein n=1 Tax=Desulfitibacter alkalitolerans TaxID=264641 RepID=UPI000484A431|nr:hypothetical protein [Desulfitibacter alkalitolerans]
MEKRNLLISLLTISIIGLIIAGSSLAYFTDKDKNPEVIFVLGNVQIQSMTAEEVNPASVFEECRTAQWTIKNTGTKQAKLRARVITNWDRDNTTGVCSSESAWAVDDSIVDKWQVSTISPLFGQGNSQARYNIFNKGGTLTLKLGYGANYTNVGTVYIRNDANKIYVEIDTINGWELSETHLYVGLTPPTNSAPGQLGNTREPNSTSYTYELPLPSGSQIYIALHAAVSSCGEEEISTSSNAAEPDYNIQVLSNGWTEVPDNNGWYYYCSSVLPQQEIEFKVRLCVTDEDWEGNLELYFEAEAVQASNNAMDHEWPQNLCN